jgi:hypothetical protein
MNTHCFTTPNKNCTNCLTQTCIKSFEFLKDCEFTNVIAQGHQGTVVNAVYKNKEIAIKFEILNDYPVTMTNRKGINCDSFWMKIPGFIEMTKAYLEFQVKNSSLYKRTTIKEFEQECDLASKLSDLKIGPNVGNLCQGFNNDGWNFRCRHLSNGKIGYDTWNSHK